MFNIKTTDIIDLIRENGYEREYNIIANKIFSVFGVHSAEAACWILCAMMDYLREDDKVER